MRRCVAERVYDGLVTSTLYTALINVSLYAVASYLTGHPAQVLVVLTILSGTVSIYTLNRITDREEDRINDPRRSLYQARHGTATLAFASVLYMASLVVLLFLKVSMFFVALLPVIIGLLYSVGRLKSRLILKNIAITAGTICSVLIVLVAFDDLTAFSILLVVFLSLVTLINTIIFDLKDIEGDRRCGIRTVPVIAGVRLTKVCCFALLAASVMMVPLLVSFTSRSYLLLGMIVYIGVYVAFAGAPDQLPRWYYGLFVDGQALFLAICCGIAIVSGWAP